MQNPNGSVALLINDTFSRDTSHTTHFLNPVRQEQLQPLFNESLPYLESFNYYYGKHATVDINTLVCSKRPGLGCVIGTPVLDMALLCFDRVCSAKRWTLCCILAPSGSVFPQPILHLVAAFSTKTITTINKSSSQRSLPAKQWFRKGRLQRPQQHLQPGQALRPAGRAGDGVAEGVGRRQPEGLILPGGHARGTVQGTFWANIE